MLLLPERQRRVTHVVERLLQKDKRRAWHVHCSIKFFTEAQFLLALHRVKLSVLTPDYKMESDSEASDIISINKRRRQDNVESDSDLEQIVFPSRNRRRILSDDEEDVQNENRERNVSSQEWIWKDAENITQ
ncbi:PREDICTED: uncharacterized protein LOC106745226 isoform X2 [Dinoponera quadriceps]|nr:PREDICTED: uncharacterized protein LOC106751761 isoform X2 [Dinoponera quadriceps]XP_014471060.1 PREDICTED: uncharacterized protein LOC106742531 isoform X2 [Dinoponera quadriceps]XP_014476116.1 PREDICTED: uncharacterized protein LOC106745226 isoform X2 [Dinoponera quadriceps]